MRKLGNVVVWILKKSLFAGVFVLVGYGWFRFQMTQANEIVIKPEATSQEIEMQLKEKKLQEMKSNPVYQQIVDRMYEKVYLEGLIDSAQVQLAAITKEEKIDAVKNRVVGVENHDLQTKR